MSRKIDQLEYAKDLLGQALGAALHTLPNDRSVLEAKGHIKQAINKLDKMLTIRRILLIGGFI